MELINQFKDKFASFDFNDNHINWAQWLEYFLRFLAVITIFRGLTYWGCIIGYFEKPDFVAASVAMQTLIVFVAVVSLIAGIGLWMLNKWGNSLWLFLLVVILVVDFTVMVTPNSSTDLSRPFYKTAFDLFQVAGYFTLSIYTSLWETKHLRN